MREQLYYSMMHSAKDECLVVACQVLLCLGGYDLSHCCSNLLTTWFDVSMLPLHALTLVYLWCGSRVQYGMWTDGQLRVVLMSYVFSSVFHAMMLILCMYNNGGGYGVEYDPSPCPPWRIRRPIDLRKSLPPKPENQVDERELKQMPANENDGEEVQWQRNGDEDAGAGKVPLLSKMYIRRVHSILYQTPDEHTKQKLAKFLECFGYDNEYTNGASDVELKHHVQIVAGQANCVLKDDSTFGFWR